ncbi:MAG: MATE family efflux transporter [Myxococcales bacterium]|nr:MATE family efflux transporter [Myxococcales bacterium]
MTASASKSIDAHDGPIGRELASLLSLAWPIALAHFGMVLLGLVDVAILGRVSATELGGASMGRSVAFTLAAIGLGVGAALEPLAAQAVGAREPERAWAALGASVRACVALWVPSAALAIGATWLLPWFGIDASLVRPARLYVLGNVPGMLGVTFFIAGKTYLLAYGRTWPTLASAAAANVVNVVACLALVGGDELLARIGLPALGLPRLGALGAGIASSFANLVLGGGTLVASVRLHRKLSRAPTAAPEHAPAPRASTPPPPTVRRVLGLSLPIGLQLLAEIGVFSVVALLAGRLGEVSVSAHQVAIGLASFTFMGALGVSSATSVRVGHAVGEGRSPRRVGLLGVGAGSAWMFLSGAAFALFPAPLVRIFTEDARIIELGTRLMYVAALFQVFDGVQAVAAGALRGAGDVRYPFAVNLGAHWLVGFPLAIVLGFYAHLGALGLWWGLLAGLVVVSVLLLARFLRISGRAIARV